ncbi:hypothetical protein [uncultured Pseudonocardia sp.]|jgi:hypothetical protein|uniref:hypothetical protein n=1 Tax=uncultured Pseudonocardia sp. TaxID=211455 RepID=UPI00261C767A|nr:hypothetical protein [uncultured Pseudonocardia sp.]
MATAHPALLARRPTHSPQVDATIPGDQLMPGTADARGQLRHALAEVGGAVIAAMSTLYTVDPTEQAVLDRQMRLLRCALEEAQRLHQSLHRL